MKLDIRQKFNPDFLTAFNQWGFLAPLLIEFQPRGLETILSVLDSNTRLIPTNIAAAVGFMGINAATINSAMLLAQVPEIRMIHVDQTVSAFRAKTMYDLPLDLMDNLAAVAGKAIDNFPIPDPIGMIESLPAAVDTLTDKAMSVFNPASLGNQAKTKRGNKTKVKERGLHPVPVGLRKHYFSTIDTRALIGAELAEAEG